MSPVILCEKVQGAAHKQCGLPCQDACRYDSDGSRTILAVADGHGSAACPYSDAGSQLAVDVFCKMMAELWQSGGEALAAHLAREGGFSVAQHIEREWKRQAEADYCQRKPEDTETQPAAIHKLYGATLLGMLITDSFYFAFQLGDGDISYVDVSGFRQVVQGDKLLGVETYSLCQKDAWKQAVTAVRHLSESDRGPAAFMLSTDGFSNSYVSDQEFEKSCKAYFDLLQKEDPETIGTHLKGWLDETSDLGCGDDVTLMIAYFDKASEALP